MLSRASQLPALLPLLPRKSLSRFSPALYPPRRPPAAGAAARKGLPQCLVEMLSDAGRLLILAPLFTGASSGFYNSMMALDNARRNGEELTARELVQMTVGTVAATIAGTAGGACFCVCSCVSARFSVFLLVLACLRVCCSVTWCFRLRRPGCCKFVTVNCCFRRQQIALQQRGIYDNKTSFRRAGMLLGPAVVASTLVTYVARPAAMVAAAGTLFVALRDACRGGVAKLRQQLAAGGTAAQLSGPLRKAARLARRRCEHLLHLVFRMVS